MTTAVVIARPFNPGGVDASSFTDITTAAVLSVDFDDLGNITVTFDGTLTQAVQDAVVKRGVQGSLTVAHLTQGDVIGKALLVPPPAPPVAAPTITVVPFVAGVRATWTGVATAGTYKVYASLSATFAGASLFAGDMPGRTAVVDSVAGTAVTPGQTVYVWVVANNAVGDGPVSASGSAVAGSADTLITDKMVSTGTIQALLAQVQTLSADWVVSGSVMTATAGRRAGMVGSQLVVFGDVDAQANDVQVFGVDGDGVLFVTGNAQFSTMSVDVENVTQTLVPRGGFVQLNGNPTAPISKPQITAVWPAPGPAATPPAGSGWTAFGVAQDPNTGGGKIVAWRQRPTDGSGYSWYVRFTGGAANDSTGPFGFNVKPVGFTVNTSRFFVLTVTPTPTMLVDAIPRVGAVAILFERVITPTEVDNDPGLGMDAAGNLMVAKIRTMDKAAYIWTISAVDGTDITARSGLTGVTFVGPMGFVARGPFDFGAGVDKIILSPESPSTGAPGAYYRSLNADLSYDGTRDWPYAAGDVSIVDGCWDGTTFWHLLSDGRFRKYTASTDTTARRWAATFADGTYQTPLGPSVAFTPLARSNTQVAIAQTFPAGADRFWIYTGPTGTASSTWTRQNTPFAVSAGYSRVLTAITSNAALAPTANTYPGTVNVSSLQDAAGNRIVDSNGRVAPQSLKVGGGAVVLGRDRGRWIGATDTNGFVTVPHSLGVVPAVVVAAISDTVNNSNVHHRPGGITATNLVFAVRDGAGAAIASTTVTIDWFAEA